MADEKETGQVETPPVEQVETPKVETPIEAAPAAEPEVAVEGGDPIRTGGRKGAL